ncbi:MAG: GNAT family N-acetyltransferase [Coriobacteriales bacterium]|nr:GNAT family N-acetyltransferase [Coriobacteriales bacterium]
MDYSIRHIEPQDNAQVEAVIRSCLIEFGANHEGTAWADPDLGRFSEVYDRPGRAYWVALDADKSVVAGVGIGELEGAEGVCELQKMYCLPDARGTGVAHRLMDKALSFAAEHYERCYLETLENMLAAQRFYQRYGFKRIYEPLVDTGHFSCDVRYLKDLRP